MINWWDLAANSVWILAMALGLAVVSAAYYKSKIENLKLKNVLDKPKYALMLNIAGAVFCVGMILTTNVWWEMVLWGVMTGLFGWQIYVIRVEG